MKTKERPKAIKGSATQGKRKTFHRNYARFYVALKALPYADKDELVSNFTNGRTTHISQTTPEEYYALCVFLENAIQTAEKRNKEREALRALRSSALHQMQHLGVDTTSWEAVDAFCKNPRIAGKRFAKLTAEELEQMTIKIRVIRRKG